MTNEEMEDLLSDFNVSEDDFEVFFLEDDPSWCCFALNVAPYEGVEVTFKEVSFAEEENEDGTLNMNFSYTVLEEADFESKEVLEADPAFKELLGNIICYLIIKNTMESIAEGSKVEQNRESNSEEPNS